MTSGDKVSWKEIRWQLFEVLDGLPAERPPVLRAMPLGFPIVEAVYTLRERVPERIGLVQRYLLEGVCRFGPSTPAALDVLLGLGEDVIEQTMGTLATCVQGVTYREGFFAAGPEAQAQLNRGLFTRQVTHQHKFLVNGLTDRLLPVNFWGAHENWRLYPNPANPEGQFRTASGQATEILIKISDRAATGREDLQRLIDEGDPDTRQRFGIPAGACERPGEPDASRPAWVLGFLLLRADDTLEIYSAHRSPVALLDREPVQKEYLQRVCQGLRSRELNRDQLVGAGGKWRESLPSGTVLAAGRSPGEVLVRVADPTGLLPHGSEGDEAESSAVRRLSQALLRGRQWEPYSWELLRLVPGDQGTAARTALLRGIHDLRAQLRPLQRGREEDQPSFDLAQWWQRWQTDYLRQIPREAAYALSPLTDLLDFADSMRDGEFLEKLEWLTE